MAISYKCLSKDYILKEVRNIRYASSELLFGFNNTISMDLDLEIDVDQLSLQADVFAREIMTHRSKFDFKRFLGPNQGDWTRLLHLAYVYDRLKCIYYGINSYNLMNFPENTYSFPGNILLMRLLSKRNFQYSVNDDQPFILYANIRNVSYPEMFLPVLNRYPTLKEGLSDTPFVITYINMQCETILKGLFYAKEFLQSKQKTNGGKSLFEIYELNDEKIEIFTVGDSNPLINSFLNSERNKFFFILSHNDSKSEALKYNASVFFSRAVGFISTQLTLDENDFFRVVTRNSINDPFTKDEVYAITGLKSNMVPLPREAVTRYMTYSDIFVNYDELRRLFNSTGDGDSSNPLPSEE